MKVKSIVSAFSSLTTNQLLYFGVAGVPIFLGILPWYSWFVALFSVPIAIVDIWGTIASVMSLWFIGLAIPLVIQLVTMPFFLLMAIFGEIILIPVAPFSPFLFVGGIIGWIYGEI